MSETKTTSKTTSKPATPVASMFEMPKFEMPKFDLPKVDLPTGLRELTEKGVAQAKDAYEKMKAAAEEANDLLEDAYTTAAKGTADYNRKVLEAARVNTNAAFDYARELLDVKSVAELTELSTTHVRKQYEALSTQTKELAALAQKVATETAEPIKTRVSTTFAKLS